MNEDLETIIREVYSCYDVRYGNAIVDLKQRIDKAIEYIEYYLRDIDNLDDVMINSIIFKEVLKILKGSDKDE